MIYVGKVTYTQSLDFFGISVVLVFKKNKRGNFVLGEIQPEYISQSVYKNEIINFIKYHKLTFGKDGVVLNYTGCKNFKLKCNNIEIR